jgi:hypothetical protein
MRRSFAVVALPFSVLAAFEACSSFKTDEQLCSNDSCNDAGTDGANRSDDGPPDVGEAGPKDGPHTPPPDAGDGGGIGDAGFSATTLASTPNVATQTGHAQQRHVVYAAASARFYFFYLDDSAQLQLKVRSSADFVTWRDETPLDLPVGHGDEGRNFSVATRVLGGVDVFHVILALHPITAGKDIHRTQHARARVTAAFEWTGLSVVTDLNAQLGPDYPPIAECDPDGPDVTISPTGVVSDVTGWQAWYDSQCDSNVFVSPKPDTGGSAWSPSFPFLPAFSFRTSFTSNVHSVASLPSGDIIGMFGNGADRLLPTNLAWSRSRAGGADADAGADAEATNWPAARSVFPADATQSRNDWSQCVVESGVLHAVRRVEGVTDVIEHRRHDGTGWSAVTTVPAPNGGRGSGIVLVSKGEKVEMLTLGGDGAVVSIAWDGAAWGKAWGTAVPAGGTRHWLSGSGCGAEPAVIWTEGAPGAERVVGERVRF